MAAGRCPRSELSIVVFGDSLSDAGSQGFGAVNLEVSTAGGYPAAAQLEPMQAIRALFSSFYPFSHFGYVEGAFTDVPVWASQLGVKAVFNFAHGSASTCQEIPGLVVPPPGYVAMPTTTGWKKLPETTVRVRGVAQQLAQAAELLAPLGVLGCPGRTLAVVFIGTNDFGFHGEHAIGKSPHEAHPCPVVQNHKQILADLASLGVPPEDVVFAGLPALELMPCFVKRQDLDLSWLSAQVDAVNQALEQLQAPRWKLAELMRSTQTLDALGIRCRVYEALEKMNGPDDLPTSSRSGTGQEAWFDEVHPSAKMHELMAQSFVQQFLD
ncbi:unnamed protein product [Polarella glacialis]|uniref:SGNH hydrolase-type esterase domain-containing protein n=1 Tax=Polarella glacialis TaxID=89957 RepID=A0A813H3C6_POLGL|nr:unnamed protein product [Polarella glacialis]